MELSSLLQPKRHGGYVDAQEYYGEYRDEYYSNPRHGKHYDHYPEIAYYSNYGSSMQMVRPYPNIVTPQPPHHHAVAHEGYYGKPHNYGKPSNFDAGYYGNHNGHNPYLHGHGYGKNQQMYGGHGHGNMYPNGPARVESSMGYNYYAENHERLGHKNRGFESAKWIAME